MFLSLLTAFGPKLLMGVAAAGAAALAYFGIRRSGALSQQAADLTQSTKEAEVANAASTDVDRLSDAAVADKLQRDWTRR